MRTILFFSLFSNITLFAENLKVDASMPWMLPWLLGAFLIVGLFFWSIYKAVQTRNAKYGYIIFFSILLMLGMLFI
ncbi:hypothetical protein KKC13_07915 [bacterium]|nr:hypothetical protein [bacterium]MBU1959079.1 hypothetical protein [bacterium]